MTIPNRGPASASARARGELDLDALRTSAGGRLLADIDRAVVWDVALRTPFRGLTRRDGVLLHGPAGWGEFAPFWDYDADACAPWLASALEQATGGSSDLPRRRNTVPVNITVPAVAPDRARALIAEAGAGTATGPTRSASRRSDAVPVTVKIKVSGARILERHALAADMARIEAVRDAIGPRGRIRIDVNGAWDPETARKILPLLDTAAQGLEYVEQPCGSVQALAELRRLVNIPIAADESIRLSADPLAVARLEAADVAIVKVAPLGGVRRALNLAERLGLPAVVSSALDTSVGIGAGLALAAALPELEHACGLGTVRLLARDVAVPSAVPADGALPVHPVHVSRALLRTASAGAEVTGHWQVRLAHITEALERRRRQETADPTRAVAGLRL
ncbi:o-succinylbenzoate synthase [Actinomyces sp.]|uniref:o-succinylbenzoate synthase n=1 Tax=Actinomyces sp. TaxID=29317 RepID=UPI0026DB12B7|nr:o-succinylbenzoate synthase [Actinomyces sp.]MDO4899306.1 o-succinylbenzoate synthase [Actinomyces sp.]